MIDFIQYKQSENVMQIISNAQCERDFFQKKNLFGDCLLKYGGGSELLDLQHFHNVK